MNYVASCSIFILVAFALCTNFEMLLADPDTAWHLAAGDFIRKAGTIPLTDPWAFTSAGVPWINLAWLWDVWMSKLNDTFGWQGQIAFNSVCVALTMTLLYNACLLRSNNGIASFFAVLLVALSIPLHLRPMQASNLFLALLFTLALHIQYRNWRVQWWYVLPALMPLWVNVHGGFIVAFALLGAFGLQALVRRQWRIAAHLTVAGLLSVAALGVNPYGYKGVYDVILSTFTAPNVEIILEFKPTTLSWAFLLTSLYIPVFFFCAIQQQAKTSLAEGLLGFGLILLAATSVRYWNFMYLFSCPILAQYFAAYTGKSRKQGHPAFMRAAEHAKSWFFISHPRMTYALASLSVAVGIAFLFSPPAARLFKLESYNPYHIVEPTLDYVRRHYPTHRFLTDYTLGGPLIAASGGTFPVFIDGRGETAYPRSLMVDYVSILNAEPGWEDIFDKYHIKGIILLSTNNKLMLRFMHHNEWSLAYNDEVSTVFIRK